MFARSILFAGVVAASPSAQLSVTTTAQTFASTHPSSSGCTTPAGTVLIDPYYCQGAIGGGFSSQLVYTVTRSTPETMVAVSFWAQTSYQTPLGSTQQGGNHDADTQTVITSPFPVIADVSLNVSGLGLLPSSGASLTAVGHASATYVPLSPTSVTFRTVIDSSGLVIDTWIDADVPGPPPFGVLQLSVVVRPAPLATSYGSSCGGATLDFEAPLNAPATVFADDPAGTLAVLLIGSTRTNTPLDQIVAMPWPCPLRTDISVSIPVPAGAFDFPFLPPPGTFTMQLLSAAGTNLNTSNGLEFVR